MPMFTGNIHLWSKHKMWCFLNRAVHLTFPQNQLGQTVQPIQLSDISGDLFGATSLVRPQSSKHLTLTKAGFPFFVYPTLFLFSLHISVSQLFFHSLFLRYSLHIYFLLFLALTILLSSDLILYYLDRQCWLRLYCRGEMLCQSQDRTHQKRIVPLAPIPV